MKRLCSTPENIFPLHSHVPESMPAAWCTPPGALVLHQKDSFFLKNLSLAGCGETAVTGYYLRFFMPWARKRTWNDSVNESFLTGQGLRYIPIGSGYNMIV